MTTDKTALAAHLAVEEGYDAQQVLQETTVKIRGIYDLYEMTLQVEVFQPNMNECTVKKKSWNFPAIPSVPRISQPESV